MIRLSLLFFFLAAEDDTAELIRKVEESGRVLEIAVPLSERVSPPVQIAPGAPPLVSFRLIEGRLRHRFGDLDLVLDDAGH
jgi:hypothetical protein